MNSTALFRLLAQEFPGFNFPVPQTGLKINGQVTVRMKAVGAEFVTRTQQGLPVNISTQVSRKIEDVGQFRVDMVTIKVIAPGAKTEEKKIWRSANIIESSEAIAA